MAGPKLIAILPKRHYTASDFYSLAKAAVDEIASGVSDDFNKTTTSWDHPVSFKKESQASSSLIKFEVSTQNQIYTWVNNGTAAHTILPKGKYLAYPGNFTPKTTPGSLSSKPGGKSGPIILSRGVNHPGGTGRFFDKAAKEKWEPKFLKAMSQVMKDFVKSKR